MNKNSVIILGLLLVVLLSIVMIKKTFFSPVVEEAEYGSLSLSISPADISKIGIKKGKSGKPFIMQINDEGEWVLPSFWNRIADQAKAHNFLNTLAMLEGEVRSRSVELYSDYGIADDEAFSISLYGKDGKLVNRVYLGTIKGSYMSTFLRQGDSPKVYVVNRDIYGLMDIYGDPKSAKIIGDKWLDLSLIQFIPNDITGIKITRGAGDLVETVVDLEKVQGTEEGSFDWKAPNDTAKSDPDPEKIKTYLNNVAAMKALKVVDPDGENYGFDEPFMLLTLLSGDEKMMFTIGALVEENKEDRYIQAPDGQAYVIAGYGIRSMNVGIDSFLSDNVPEAGPEVGAPTAENPE